MRRTHQFNGSTFFLLGTAALAAVLSAGCDGEEPETVAATNDDDSEAASESSGDAPADADVPDGGAARSEIVENLLEAGYFDDAITVDDAGRVIVGGDAIVTLAASREMVGLTRRGESADSDTAFRQYRTPGVVSTAIANICVDGAAFVGIPELNAALDTTIARYNAQNLSFNMTRTAGPTAGCSAVITGVLVGGSGGLAGFPSGGLPFETIEIGAGLAAYGEAVASHVIEHELGHCIGLRHSDWFDRSLSCGIGGAESSATHIPHTPVGADPDSVMTACFSATRTGVFSAEDLDALHFVYGRDCCASGDGAGCGNVPVNECVGAADPYCNDVFWDGLCAGEVTSLGCGSCPAPVDHSCCTTGTAGCENNVIELGVCATDSYCCDVAWDAICVGEVASLGFGLCGSTCCGPHGAPGCDDGGVQACVCADDPYCCGTAWDSLCVAEVESLGCSQCG